MSIQEQFAEPALPDFAPALCVYAPANSNRAQPLYPILKRSIDVIGAVAMLVLAAPLMLAVAVAIRLDSDGPVAFRQTRLGRGGRPFAILKFRTMNVIEDGGAVVQAAHNDSRVTRVGRYLRAASLDELPQLFNVLRGEMSLVGPRPHAAAHDALYAALIPNYELRQDVKPGITGWAQVNGHRGGTPALELMQRRIDFDVWYVANASMALDLKILLRTPIEVLSPRNAY